MRANIASFNQLKVIGIIQIHLLIFFGLKLIFKCIEVLLEKKFLRTPMRTLYSRYVFFITKFKFEFEID